MKILRVMDMIKNKYFIPNAIIKRRYRNAFTKTGRCSYDVYWNKKGSPICRVPTDSDYIITFAASNSLDNFFHDDSISTINNVSIRFTTGLIVRYNGYRNLGMFLNTDRMVDFDSFERG